MGFELVCTPRREEKRLILNRTPPLRALVTGGCGFIGSHLVDRLVQERIEVVILDNLLSGRLENIAHHKGSQQVQFYQEDITDYQAIEKYFKGIDWVFHLAARGEIVPSIHQPLDYQRDNVQGTTCVVEAARQNAVKRFVYAASSSCYGIPKDYPTTEEAEIQTRYPYALTKYLGEQIVLHWGKVYKLPVVSLRIGNAYGPRSRTSGAYGAVIGTFLAQKLNNKPYTLVGDGTQQRDFLYVQDLAQAFFLAAASSRLQQVYNVGSDNPQTINRLIELLGRQEIVHLPKRPGEPDVIFLSTAKIKKELGWKPMVSFEKGMAQVLAHQDHWRKAPVWTKESIAEVTKDWFRYLS